MSALWVYINNASIPFMKLTANRFNKLTLLSAAGYFFIFTLAAKGVFLYAFLHPAKNNLISVEGMVKQVRLGGKGKSASFLIVSDSGT